MQIKKNFDCDVMMTLPTPLVTLNTGWQSIVPSLMLVSLAVSEELEQTDRHTGRQTEFALYSIDYSLCDA